ncbi:VanZ family protein [Streptomyces aidingensis]|uniref:Glycopeptide antibiotics resistance protein n=1 Tax=Streptomyces aidingensis TaxID=910347 RepID=A0A1I1PAQ6_9ACTN|nr:VanZ family protein [Streptomyces aidingensis]SFD06879.1 Glycopeptide antibiotics resistance protein [Streptomyces aidingensis]
MLRPYLLPVETALWLFPVVAALVLVPAAVRGYRSRGRAGGWSALVGYSFVFYLLAAFLQTVVPLPRESEGLCGAMRYAAGPQLEPLEFVRAVSEAGGGSWAPGGLVGLLPFWTTLLNFVLLLPLGVYLRYYLRQGPAAATVLAFGTSLFFETTQYTGLWYTYPCPYRQFNVDDLLLNTLGAVLGWLLAGPLGRLLPRHDPDRERARYGPRVTLPRRALAHGADLAGWLIAWTLATGLLSVGAEWATGRRHAILLGTALAVLWFWLLPLAWGATPGQRAVLLKVARPDGRRAGPVRLTARQVLTHAPLGLGWALLAVRTGVLPSPGGTAETLLWWATGAAALLAWVWSPLAVLWRRDGRAPAERWTGTAVLATPNRRERRRLRARKRDRDGAPDHEPGRGRDAGPGRTAVEAARRPA